MQQQKPNAAKNKINKINKFIYKKRYGPFNKRYAKLNNNEMPYFKKKFLHSVEYLLNIYSVRYWAGTQETHEGT